ncbi:MAG: GNAT family N-acetyltransferase [bacterium]
MNTEIRLLESHEAAVLDHVARGVFDKAVDRQLTAEFFADARHHLAVAIEDGVVVGMASAVHYVHPDKPPQLFINEVGVAPTHQGRRFGRQLVELLVKLATDLGCTEAWVLTDSSNVVAQRLYEGAGGETPPDSCIMYTIRIVPAAVVD